MNYRHLKKASATVLEGGVIAYPTEAVYGLGCLPECFSAIQRILELKHRPIEKGLIIVAAEFRQLEGFVAFPSPEIEQTVLASWPGPVTWLVPARPDVSHWLTGEHKCLAVRLSAHPQVRALCRLTGPLVSTSANPASLEPARTSLEVQSYFADAIDYILPGETGDLQNPTQIKDALTGAILR